MPSVLWRSDAIGWAAGRASGLQKTGWWGAVAVFCLERGADLHMAHLMPLPLSVSCCSNIQIGFTFLVLAHPGSPGQRAVKRVPYVCVMALNSRPIMCWCAVKKLLTHSLTLAFTVWCLLPINAARSSSGGVAIRYVLPVLSTMFADNGHVKACQIVSGVAAMRADWQQVAVADW